MKLKNMFIFISLLFILLTISCASATQEVDIDNALAASDTAINEVSSDDELRGNVISDENILREPSSSELQSEVNNASEGSISTNDVLTIGEEDIILGAGNVIETKLITPNRTIYVSDAMDGYTYQVILKDKNGKALSNKKLTFDFNNQTLTAKTDNVGWAKVNLIANQAGIYNVLVTFAGDKSHAAISQNGTIKLVRENTRFVAPNRVFYTKDMAGGYNYSVILKTKDGMPLANKKVMLNIEGKKQILMTDDKGYATFYIDIDTPGVHIMELKFAGTISCYNGVTETRTLNLIRIPTSLIAPNRVLDIYDVVDGYTYSAILKDKDNKPLADKTLTLTLNDKKYSAVTGKDGWANFNIELAVEGVNTVDITFEGDKYYNPVIEQRTIKLVKSGNPYGKKAKKAWINCDSGSDDMKKAVADLLRKNGWTVYVDGTGPGYHYDGYFDVTSDYQVYITLYNGFCAGTIREAYSSSIQNTLNKKDVTLVVMWDTRDWTNPDGMKPYRYGNFTGYNASKAWDDDFSEDDPYIENVGGWLKEQNAKYCAYPSAEGLVAQFLAGGYFALHPEG